MKFFNTLTIIFCTVLALVSTSFAAETNCTGVDTGTKAYNDGDFERAIDEWRTCVDSGIRNADLFYNLGNAYFRNGNLGFSIFYYKQALRLKANDEDIQHNLNFAEAMTRDKVEEEEENPILSTLFKLHHTLSLKTQLILLLILFWTTILIAIYRKISLNEKMKNVGMGAIFVLTMVFSVIAASTAYKIFVLETEISGVVTAKDADVTSAPSNKAPTLNTLSEGTSFEVLGEQGIFVEIRLGEKIRGFVKKSDVGIVQ